MATRFVRVDLSDEARDFRPIAVEPGVPLLDRSNSNAKILYRWLGGMVAEPVWEGESVNFYARDDHGGRLEEVVCQTATREDLETSLKGDLAALKDRIEKAKPETPTERLLRKTLLRLLQELVENPNRTDLDCYFFRYRDVQGRWRLVWCWGFQRVDQVPAPAVVCTDPDCSLLFVRRPGQRPKCPSCEAALVGKPVRRVNWKRVALVGLLLCLFVGALLAWWYHPKPLLATPANWSGPEGSRIEFKVTQRRWWFWKTDVTHQAVGVVLDPRVARLEPSGDAAVALNPGKTRIRFHLGKLTADAQIVVSEASNPEKLFFEPADPIELAVGSTTRLKLFGQYKDGSKADLTSAAQWVPKNDGVVFAMKGLVEGRGDGTSSVQVKYRATRADKEMTAAATVKVEKVDFQSLQAAIEPLPVCVGRTSRLQIEAVSGDGRKYSVLESSLLKIEVQPPYLATVQGRNIKGEQAGRGRLAATFTGDKTLTAEAEFEVATGPGLDRLVVYPEKLKMVVGEIIDLGIASPGTAPVQVTSADPAVVEITKDNRLVGRSEGQVQVEVSQGDEKRLVNVEVERVEFTGIAIRPDHLVVPVDDAVRAQVWATIKVEDGELNVEIAPDLLGVEAAPAKQYADFNPKLLELRGVNPTDYPEPLALHLGRLKDAATVAVIVPPLQLTITPAGKIDLPLGQMKRLQAWANYSGGRRVQVSSDRLKWESEPKSVAGLELRDGRVAAIKAGAGPLAVRATYELRSKRKPNEVLCREKSNTAEFRSVEAEPLTLRLEVDRTLRLAGERGYVILAGSGPRGDVELVPEMAAFHSPAPKVVQIGEKSGAFLAVAPGEAVLTASHPAAKDAKPASLKLRVFDPANARLVFDPPSLRLAVNEVGRLQLLLEVHDGGKPERAPLAGPGVGYAVSQDDAIRWYPPTVVGLRPAEKIELSASFFGKTASARIDVDPVIQPESIRIVPSDESLSPGQTQAFRLEQQVPGKTDQYKEVRPDAVAWTVPPGLVWAPATKDLRPAATIPAAAKDEYVLQASYAGQQARAIIRVKAEGPNPNASDARLEPVREPGGEFLPIGHEQRYAIVVRQDSAEQVAADIQWPSNFENDYVRWQAPVLTAKRGGYTQWLRAEVGGRAVLFHTTTYEPGAFERPELPRGDEHKDRPRLVKFVRDKGKPLSIRIPVGVEFSDFEVWAEFNDGFVRRNAAKKATYSTPEPPESAPVAASAGRLRALRKGTTKVYADFEGTRTVQPLQVEVVAADQIAKMIDEIRLNPATVTMLPHENIPLEAVGYSAGQPVGIITGLPGLVWQSSNPKVAVVNGPRVTALELGRAGVTAALDAIVSKPAPVSVVASTADVESLVIDAKGLQLRVGEAARIGTDVVISRGGIDLSRQCAVTPDLSTVVRYVPETNSLVGVSPGVSDVVFAFGERLARLRVEVLPGGAIVADIRQVIVEPASGILAPGQALPLRVVAVTQTGHAIDRTDSAVLSSSDPAKVKMLGNLACAVASGTAQITATLPETKVTGSAQVAVNNEDITQVWVDPPRLDMSVGDRARLRIMGRAASGTYELFPQGDLKLGLGGANPSAIRIEGAGDVHAVAPGQAEVAVNWRNRLAAQVSVNVAENALADLQVEPAQATVHPGEGLVYRVTGLRGGQRRVLGPEDGVGLLTSNPEVAQVFEGLKVGASKPGRAVVTARVGDQQASAALDVIEGIVGVVPRDGGSIIPATEWERIGWRFAPGVGWVPVGPGGVVERVPGVAVAGLRFSPDTLRLAPDSPPSGVRVYEVAADGSILREVTLDPDLEVGPSTDVAAVEKTAAGPAIRPVKPGQTRMGAKLGNQIADQLLLIDVGGGLVTGPVVPVVSPDELWIEPAKQTCTVGATTARLVVMAQTKGGQPYQVPATLQSMDDSVLTPDPDVPGQFLAKSFGSTQVRAEYRGREAFARVTVSGKLFENVETAFHRYDADKAFDVGIKVLAAQPEGSLQYRVYVAGQPPAQEEGWKPAQRKGEDLEVDLLSPRMPQSLETLYHLIIEAREASGGAVQQYPLTFRLVPTFERADNR